MFVVEVGSLLTTVLFVQAAAGRRRSAGRLHPGDRGSGCGSPCSSPTSPRPWPRAGARPRPTACARARRDVLGQEVSPGPQREASRERGLRRHCSARRRRPGGSRRLHSRRWRGDRGRRLGGRERHHRRKRAGHPRERAATAARSPAAHGCSPTGWWCAITANPGRDLPGPHDRHGGRRQAAEDAQRDRPEHPAGGSHDHLPAGRPHPAALLAL